MFIVFAVCFSGILRSKIHRKNGEKLPIISTRIYLVFGILFFCSAAFILMNKMQAPSQLKDVTEIFAALIYNHKQIVVEIIHYIVPNWHLFWMADALSSGKIIPTQYVVSTVLVIPEKHGS